MAPISHREMISFSLFFFVVSMRGRSVSQLFFFSIFFFAVKRIVVHHLLVPRAAVTGRVHAPTKTVLCYRGRYRHWRVLTKAGACVN